MSAPRILPSTVVEEDFMSAKINVFASGGVVADCGRFAYVLYVKEEDFHHAARVLDAD